ncbi:MAG: hypothetical protein K8U03_25685 [Planctomycetia bacterium]|nr:hypothetical protein [Planctomycetia bacterium]
MGKTPREQMLVMLLPALLVIGGYVLGYSRDSELKAASKSLEALRPSAVSPMDVVAEKLKLENSQEKLDGVKKEKTEWDARWKSLGAMQITEPQLRTNALRQISKMLWDRGLYPFEESAATNSGDLPPSFQEALNRLNKDNTSPGTTRLWKIRFYGRYADVLETLESLRDSGSSVIPVALSMSETSSETAWRSWTLLLWI